MGLQQIEALLYSISSIFLMPVMIIIGVFLLYALFSLGIFIQENIQRMRGSYQSVLAAHAMQLDATNKAYQVTDELELWIMKRLEWLRIVSRAAPMLGLVATMIPMGPALLALTTHDTQAVAQNMTAAFSAVILALVSASICYFILTVRKRWLLQELRQLEVSLNTEQ